MMTDCKKVELKVEPKVELRVELRVEPKVELRALTNKKCKLPK